MTLSQIDEAMSIACDKICKYPEQYSDQDDLIYEKCDTCPLGAKLEEFQGGLDAVEYLKLVRKMIEEGKVGGAYYRKMQLDMPEQAVKLVQNWQLKKEIGK